MECKIGGSGTAAKQLRNEQARPVLRIGPVVTGNGREAATGPLEFNLNRSRMV